MYIEKETLELIIKAQKNELTESIIYSKLSKLVKTENEKNIFYELSLSELGHHNFWKNYTKIKVKPNYLKIYFYYYLTKIFGLSFGVKLLEKGEGTSQENYKKLIEEFPEIDEIIKTEEKHEKKLISMINDNKLKYLSSIVLGLNDALVEITGALAGLSMTLQNPKIVGISGLIIGISAAISMASSEYLSSKEEESEEINPKKAAIYTGFAYILTVILLVSPFLLNLNIYLSLGLSILNALVIIGFFNYYISIAKGESFKKRFFEMASISIGVAIFSFVLGLIVNTLFGIQI